MTSSACGTFTRARRYPLVIGRVWGRRITLNFVVGAAIGVGVVRLLSPLWQHGFLADNQWGPYVAVGLACGAFVHQGRLDGRAPLWTIAAVVMWLVKEAPTNFVAAVSNRPLWVTVPDVYISAPLTPVVGHKAALWVAPRVAA